MFKEDPSHVAVWVFCWVARPALLPAGIHKALEFDQKSVSLHSYETDIEYLVGMHREFYFRFTWQ